MQSMILSTENSSDNIYQNVVPLMSIAVFTKEHDVTHSKIIHPQDMSW